MSDTILRPAGLVFWSAFAVVSCVLYVFAMEMNLAAFTYHPRLVEFDLGPQPARSGPAMYWFGWTATSIGGGLVGGALALVVARGLTMRVWLWLGWSVPAVAMIVACYFMIPFFTK